MSHASDGELHAYLDGALGGRDAAAEERLAAHLESCADCRSRLETARSLRGQATELLASVTPDPARVPPFEQVLAAADSPARRARPWWVSRGVGLAWAASVALALGVGWIGGGGVGDPGPADRLVSLNETEQTQTARGQTDPAALADESDPSRSQELPLAAAELKTDEAAGLDSPAENRSVRGDDPAADASEAEPDADRPALASRVGRAEPVEAPAAPAPEEQAPAAGVSEVQAVAQEEDATETQERAAAEDELEAARQNAPVAEAHPAPARGGRGGLGDRDRAAGSEAVWIRVDPFDAKRWLAGPVLAVPELELLTVEISEQEGRRVVRSRQRLGSDAVLEIFQRAPRMTEPAAAPVDRRVEVDRLARKDAEGKAEVARWADSVRGFEVELAAPVAVDSLRVLLSKLRPRNEDR